MAWTHATRLGAIAVAAAGLAAACAGGSETTRGDDDGSSVTSSQQSTGTGTSTGVGGTPGSGGATVGGGATTNTGGSGGAGGSGGSPGPCSEQPCKVTAPQCGCFSGEKCTLGGSSFERTCAPDGSKGVGQVCSGDCAAGALCLTLGTQSTSTASCKKFCDSDSECTAPGGLCTLTLTNSMGSIIPEKFCSENCDPVSNTGCELGLACEVSDDNGAPFTVCRSAGASTQGAPCSNFDDCAATFTCVTIDGVAQCARYCNVNAPSCPGSGEQCLKYEMPIVIGGTEYGACYAP